MDFEIHLPDSKKYLVCRPTVPITLEATQAMAEAVGKVALESGVQDRLIDVRGVRNVMSVSANYDMAYKGLEDMKVERSTKVAVLISADDNSHEFVCMAIRNSGFNLRTFTEESAAIAWLEEE